MDVAETINAVLKALALTGGLVAGLIFVGLQILIKELEFRSKSRQEP